MSERCPSCGRALTRDDCRHDDCGWRPPFLFGPVDPARGLAWVRRVRARLEKAADEVAA